MERAPWHVAPLQGPLPVGATRTDGWLVWAPQGSCGPLSLRGAPPFVSYVAEGQGPQGLESPASGDSGQSTLSAAPTWRRGNTLSTPALKLVGRFFPLTLNAGSFDLFKIIIFIVHSVGDGAVIVTLIVGVFNLHEKKHVIM